MSSPLSIHPSSCLTPLFTTGHCRSFFIRPTPKLFETKETVLLISPRTNGKQDRELRTDLISTLRTSTSSVERCTPDFGSSYCRVVLHTLSKSRRDEVSLKINVPFFFGRLNNQAKKHRTSVVVRIEMSYGFVYGCFYVFSNLTKISFYRSKLSFIIHSPSLTGLSPRLRPICRCFYL